jgi:tRNA-dihydrouridine synthase B
MTTSAQTFWHTLATQTPIIGLSPMDGVTDHPHRHITKKYGKPAVMYTEFTSVEGLCHGADHLVRDFMFDETQRPIIGQIYGTTPDFFRQSAIVLCQLGFDGVDINMGCPAKNVAHSGAGAALIKTPKLAQEIIASTKQGIQEWLNGATCRNCPDISSHLCNYIEAKQQHLPPLYQHPPRAIPVSVKTRIGFDQPAINEWIPTVIEMEPAAIALHGRTLKQQYGGLASWENIAKAAELVKQTPTLILGNGDIQSLKDAHQRVKEANVDGALIGRATMGNPWVFTDMEPTDHPERFAVALEHCKIYEEVYKDHPKFGFMPMRKHLGWYVKNIENASQIRIELFQSNNSQEVEHILTKHSLLS